MPDVGRSKRWWEMMVTDNATRRRRLARFASVPMEVWPSSSSTATWSSYSRPADAAAGIIEERRKLRLIQ